MVFHMIQSPVGPLKITVEDAYVIGLEFSEDTTALQRTVGPQTLTPDPHHSVEPQRLENLQNENLNIPVRKDLNILKQAIQELEAYFAGRLCEFTVPISLTGTPFQLKVWQAMRNIGYGETKTYRELAKAAGYPKAARAVGNACAANPIAIIVPCHRVLAQNGLGGFGGGLYAKRWLLNLEKQALK